jgi:hypothetical protein
MPAYVNQQNIYIGVKKKSRKLSMKGRVLLKNQISLKYLAKAVNMLSIYCKQV